MKESRRLEAMEEGTVTAKKDRVESSQTWAYLSASVAQCGWDGKMDALKRARAAIERKAAGTSAVLTS